MTRRSIRGLAMSGLLGALLALMVGASGSVAVAADHGVDIAGFAFSPQTITVGVGDTITWSNADAQSHTATANDGSFDTGTIHGSTSASVKFTTAGTFAYHCSIHRSMTATVVVEDAAATPPPTDTIAATARQGTPTAWIVLALALALAVALVLGRQRFRGPFGARTTTRR